MKCLCIYGRKYDFESYIDEAKVGENSCSSNVAYNKEEETEKLSSAAKGSEVESTVQSCVWYHA